MGIVDSALAIREINNGNWERLAIAQWGVVFGVIDTLTSIKILAFSFIGPMNWPFVPTPGAN